MALVTRNRVMPPWKADPAGHKFIGLDPLSDAEIDILQRWVADGAREGDRRDLPTPPTLDRRLAARHTRSRRHAADAVRASGRGTGRLARVRAAAARRSPALRARHRVPRRTTRGFITRTSASMRRRRRASSTSRTRRPATTASSCVRRSIPTGISSDGRRDRLLLFCRRGSRGRSRPEATSSCSCTSCPAENRS